jgi:hypothetical protein
MIGWSVEFPAQRNRAACFVYPRFDRFPINRQRNHVSDILSRAAKNTKMAHRAIPKGQHDIVFHLYLQPMVLNDDCSLIEITRNYSEMFRGLACEPTSPVADS